MKKALPHHFGALYHLMTRGNNRQEIFFDKDDRCYYLALLENTLSRFEHQIHAYCLMSNHTHLLIQVGSVPICDIMHNLNTRYARWINIKYKKVGHLFQGRYKAQYVDSRDYLIRLIRYIHLNPVKANMVKDPSEYPWSSHLVYTHQLEQAWLSTKWALLHFDNDYETALQKYMLYIQEAIDESLDEDLLLQIDTLNSENNQTLVRKPEDLIRDTRERKATFNSIVEFCCTQHQLNINKLKGLDSSRVYVCCRLEIAWLSKHLQISSISSTAAFFGKNANHFGKIKNKYEERHAEDLLLLKERYLDYLEQL